MRSVLFVTAPEAGHIYPTLNLSRHLVLHGHEVTYFAAPQFRKTVESIGARILPMLPEASNEQEVSGCNIWSQFTPKGRHLRARKLDVVLRGILEETSYNLVLCDRLYATDYRCRLKEVLEGRPHLLFSTSLLNWKEYERSKALDTLMLIFCPEQLEIPKFKYPCGGLHYVEPSLRPTDDETSFCNLLDPGKRMVLVAFGTQSIRYRRLLEQCEMIEEIAKRQKDVQFVVAAGAVFRSFQNSASASVRNLFVYDKVPQRRLLERASTFISHGGLGGIKEAIMARVPSIILPVSHDQPFNAMRVRYHGLGEAIFPDRQTLKAVEASLLAAMDGRYENEVCAMHDIFQRSEASKPSEFLIRPYLEGT